ncbi:MAG: radical SAM protein [Dehalococcoidia bacterium]|nr:MAG: radical SAM protein [Dehalococcoidia bacterium]
MHDEIAVIKPRLNLVAWEITRSCNLACAHCRASAVNERYPDELSTDDCYRLIDGIVEVGKPIIILTGGEPLARSDVFDIARYAVSKGLRVVMGTNGTLISEQIACELKKVPVSRIAVSLDFPDAPLQDKFRGQSGAYAAAMSGIAAIKKADIELQINCTLTKLNISYLDQLLQISLNLDAVAFHPFFLVPTGRGKGLEEVELSSEAYEKTLNWIYDKQLELGDRIFFKPTDAPHYLRIMKQREKHLAKQGGACAGTLSFSVHPHSITRGCLAGTGFCFISHTGIVQGCGYLDIEAGDIKKQTFGKIWSDSPLFNALRDLTNIKGKCGNCEYKRICGGCRARAYEATGDFLEAEPYCLYQPRMQQKV